VYAAIRSLGRSGIADLIDRCCTHATALANGISALDGAEMVVPPLLNQALVRFLAHGDNVHEEDHDRETVAVISAINRAGIAFFSGTTWKSRYTMRISVINWRTTEADVAATIASVDQVLRSRNGDKARSCDREDD
jgi:aromatic-L-amino-acid decarboxylase